MLERSEAGLPRIRARNVLFDVDGTIVESCGGAGGDTFERVLVALVARRQGITEDEARRLVRSVYDPERECVSRALQAVGVSEEEYLAELLLVLGQGTRVCADAGVIDALRGRGFKIFPATTNSGFAIHAKLACDGAHGALVDCFSALLGGAEVCPEGKAGPEFYRALIERLDIDPGLTVMVGDNPTADLLYALEAGIRAAVIVRRGQGAEWMVESGGVYVRSLDILPRILELAE